MLLIILLNLVFCFEHFVFLIGDFSVVVLKIGLGLKIGLTTTFESLISESTHFDSVSSRT